MKTKLLVLLIVCFAFSDNITAQSYQWAKGGGGTSGDYGNSIAVDPAGNSYVTGWFQNTTIFDAFSLTSAGGYDIFILKYDPNGQIIWAKRAGGSGTDIGYGIDLDNYGNVYVAGTFAGTANFGGITETSYNGSPDIFVARYDTAGNAFWVQKAGSTTDDQAQAIAVNRVTGKVFITGYFKSVATFGLLPLLSSGQSDMFVAAYDSIATMNGTPIWLQKGGGPGYEIASGICTGDAGNVYVTGNFAATATFNSLTVTSAGSEDVFVAKYNSAGAVQWVHRDGGTNFENGLSVSSAGNGVYYTGWFDGNAVFGTVNLSGMLDEIFISKLDTSGTIQWAASAGGSGYDQGYGILYDTAGSVYVTGAFDSAAQFGPVNLTSAGSWDVFIAKYSAAGVFQWVMSGGGTAANTFERDIGYSIKKDMMQNLYVTGIIRNTASFGPFSVTSSGIQDVFVAKISTLPSSIDETVSGSFLLYPNPVQDELFLQIPGTEQRAEVRILDITGREIFKTEFLNPASGLRIVTASFSTGLYLLEITHGNKKAVAKFLKSG